MTKSIKGTRTEKNLMTSFAGESQARMRYISSWKQPIRKRNTLNACSSGSRVVW